MAAAASTRAFHDESHHCPATALPACSRDASTDRARTQQSAPTPDLVRLPRAILRPSPASSRSSPPPERPPRRPRPAIPTTSRRARPRARGSRAWMPLSRNADVTPPPTAQMPTIRGTLTMDAPRGNTPIIVPPKDRTPEQRARGARSTRRRAEATVEQREKERLRSCRGRRGMTDQERKLESKAKRAPHPRPKHPTTRRRTRARRPGVQRRANRVSGVPRPAGPLRRRQRQRRPRVAHLTPPRWRRRRRAERRGRPRNNARRSASVRWLGVRMTPEERKRANDARQRRLGPRSG